jgi:hypothetical protein
MYAPIFCADSGKFIRRPRENQPSVSRIPKSFLRMFAECPMGATTHAKYIRA